MNYEKFYKMAEENDNNDSSSQNTTQDSSKQSGGEEQNLNPKDFKYNQRMNNVYGWNEQLPMLALLAGTGALGGWALSAKKKKGSGAAYGAISLPALYAMYIASRRNGILPNKKNSDDFLDKGFNKINNTVNPYLPEWFNKKEDA